MINSTPFISVVMPVYNGEKYLSEAIESILNQTFLNFELIVINDGSTDNTAGILDRYRKKDRRIVKNSHTQNQGIVYSLNQGLKLARGKYIARMDSDDISCSDRLEKQAGYLESNPQIGILGGDVIYINPAGQELSRMEHPHDDLSIRWTCLLNNVFFHPTVMFRRSILIENELTYKSAFQSVEDYAFWVEFLEHTKGANLDQVLIYYRLHPGSLTSKSRNEQTKKHNQVSWAYINRIFPDYHVPSLEHAMLVAAFSGKLNVSSNSFRPILAEYYLKLWHLFCDRHSKNPGLNFTKHKVVILAAKIGLYPLFQPGWLKTFFSLFKEDILWIFYFILEFPKMFWLKLKGNKLRKLREDIP